MKAVQKSIAVAVLCGVSLAAGFFGFNVVQNARFAHAEQTVEASRESLAQVEDLSRVFRHVGRVIEPSVVNIEVTRTVRAPRRGPRSPFDDLRRRFFEEMPDQPRAPEAPDGPEAERDFREFQRMGTGSGVIMEVLDGYGYIVTNNHVAGDATAMTIRLADGRSFENAELVGGDPRTDVAVVRIQADRLIPAQWGDSDELEKGDWVLAFGSPFGFVGSMTHGIVSALGRQTRILGDMGYENFIQTDAAINPGNSGGPLVNLRGEVIGINTAIASGTGGFQGIGFAIPSNQARFVYEQLRDEGQVTRGWLGVVIENVTEVREVVRDLGYDRDRGVFIHDLVPDAPVEGQLQAEDIIVSMNGRPVDNVNQLRNEVARIQPGSEIELEVFRDGEVQTVTITMGRQPEDPFAAARREGTAPPQLDPDEQTVRELGLQLRTLTQPLEEMPRFQRGALITGVEPDSPAWQKVFVGEVIVRIGDRDVAGAQDAREAFAAHDLSEGVRIRVANPRGARSVFLRVN